MIKPKSLVLTLTLLLAFIHTGPAVRASGLDWPETTVENRPGCYWWWMGSAVDSANITWNLEILRRAGIGGVTLVPIYGARGYERQYIQYLSPRWVAMMSHAAREADRLGMWLDMTTGTGWPFGGPMVSDSSADAVVEYSDGNLSWRFSGQKVKRAAPGNEGPALNPFSSRAMSAYLASFDSAFAGVDLTLPRAMYHDSFEYQADWCPELPAEFERLRGYNLLDHLPELFGNGDGETVARVKSDYRETLSDLHLAYVQTWVRWSDSIGCGTRNQAHGSPANLLDLYAVSSIPETEIFGASEFSIPGIRLEEGTVDGRNHPQPLINRMASSAAHVSGKPLAAAEACTWLRNHFHTALSQAKPEIDQLFLCGINHIFIHGSCYSPSQAPWPGWLFYASMEYNPRNAIWRDAPALNEYIARCQSILQAGQPDNDIALYWPVHDVWHSPDGLRHELTVHAPAWLTESPCGELAQWLIDNGYGFDYISDRQLTAGLDKPYKVLLVPPTGHMPRTTLERMLEEADQGKPVIFLDSLPAGVPGLLNFQERRSELKEMLRGRDNLAVSRANLRERLEAAGTVREPLAESGLSYIRRSYDEGYHYFIANMGSRPVDCWVALGVPFQGAAVMDPLTARTGLATRRGEREIYLQLLPGETRIIRTFGNAVPDGPQWPLYSRNGSMALEITGNWRVEFIDGGPELPEAFDTGELKSWTELGDKEARRFAGTALYRIEFELPAIAAGGWELDLGDVRESARVRINGKPAARLWGVPFAAPVGEFLQPGKNVMEIEVTNLSANRIRDLDRRRVDWKIFRDINFVDHDYQSFDASNWLLVPSGLLGPVRLIPLTGLVPQ